MRYFSMFSGIGGFEKGIEDALRSIQPNISEGSGDLHNTQNKLVKWKCVGFSEIDKNAINIYKHHFPGHHNYGSAFDIKTADLPDFDFLCGGFPCQAFSIAGKRLGFQDTRGTLFFEIARILSDKRPRNFLLENVKGLLSHDEGKTFQTILGVLSDLGYWVEWQVLNSKNHGVPQNRERVFFVGHLGGEPARKVFPIEGADGQDSVELRQVGNVDTKGHNSIRLMNEYRIRRLTPIECERLQGFPDDWTKYGADGKVMSDSARYKACGNAVTTNVIRAIVERLFAHKVEAATL